MVLSHHSTSISFHRTSQSDYPTPPADPCSAPPHPPPRPQGSSCRPHHRHRIIIHHRPLPNSPFPRQRLTPTSPQNHHTPRNSPSKQPTAIMASTDPKAEQDKPLEQKTEQKPATLGEDDEFEDFPVDGTILLSTGYCASRAFQQALLHLHPDKNTQYDKVADKTQTGQRTRPRRPRTAARQSTCGRKAGTMTTRATTFQHSSSGCPQAPVPGQDRH